MRPSISPQSIKASSSIAILGLVNLQISFSERKNETEEKERMREKEQRDEDT